MTKAYKIDVDSKDIVEIELGDYKDISKQISCEVFTCVYIDNETVVYVDDMGLLKDLTKGFKGDFYASPIMGNGIVVSTNEEGEDIDIKIPLEEIKRRVQFIEFDEAPEAPPVRVIPIGF